MREYEDALKKKTVSEYSISGSVDCLAIKLWVQLCKHIFQGGTFTTQKFKVKDDYFQ